MTILYHPVAEALQTAQTSGSTAAITTTSKTTSNTMNTFHLIATASRDKNQDEEEI
jgi:hypothetical protein